MRRVGVAWGFRGAPDVRPSPAIYAAAVEWDPGPEPVGDEQRRRNDRLLLWIIGVGAVVVLTLVAVGFVLVRRYLDDATSYEATISAKYQHEYRQCVLNHKSRESCAAQAEQDCAADPRWLQHGDSDLSVLNKISSACRFGPDSAG
jgi:hypothetical protein